MFGCSGKGSDQPQANKTEQKTAVDDGGNLALKFLQGAQDGDKTRMYEAANLTTEIVNDSKDKLIHSKQNILSDSQRIEFEHALRISGNIDFFIAKIRKMLPKSATIQITKSMDGNVIDGIKKGEHTVKLTYSSRAEAMSDKTGRPVKELVLHLLQISRSVNGRWIHDFSFDSKEFDKMADKDFEVLSYY